MQALYNVWGPVTLLQTRDKKFHAHGVLCSKPHKYVRNVAGRFTDDVMNREFMWPLISLARDNMHMALPSDHMSVMVWKMYDQLVIQ